MEPVVNLTPSCGLKGKLIPKPTSAEEEAHDVYAFLGVPYAEPPVGSLRFTDPRPVSLWSGVRSAIEFGAVCPQDFSMLIEFPFPVSQPSRVSEDCLFLNIWTPTLTSESRLPVMVWIYGGGFTTGFSDLYDAQALACHHNVVFVSLNYRVGSLGFMCLNDASVAGNYGLLDQIEALKWVQKYISNFGGDPDNVTIFGESAGGVSSSLLVLSPLAKGLFRRAIAESGTAYTAIAAQTSKNAFERNHAHMAKHMTGCPPATAPASEIVEFLRSQPVDDLVDVFKKDNHQFCPVIDGRVLATCPAEMYERGDFNPCEMVIGCCNSEGWLLYQMIVLKVFKAMGIDEEHVNVDVARSIISNLIKSLWDVHNGEQVAKAICDCYFPEGSATSSEDLQKAIVECLGDWLFVFPTIQAASCHSRKCKTYVYQFCHRPPFLKGPSWVHADHGSEVFYALRLNGSELNMKDEDVKLSRQMATYWTNFARNGNPNGKDLEGWPEYDETARKHLRLELPTAKTESNLMDGRSDLWLHQLPKIMNPDQQ